jgi:hypothetical protein
MGVERLKNYIDGKWVNSRADTFLEVTDSLTG